MSDPRGAAREFLSNLLAGRCPGCAEVEHASHIDKHDAGYRADALLDAEGVQVDQHVALDPTTLNLAGKRITITLPLMPLSPEDLEWMLTPDPSGASND